MAHLIQIAGSTRVEAGEFDGDSVRIGRDHKHNDIVIPDGSVSRKHAVIRFEDGDCVIEDLGSRNRTLVNDDPVEARSLEEGDRIQIGNVTFLFGGGPDAGGPPLSVRREEAAGPAVGSIASTQVGVIAPGGRDLLGLQQDSARLGALFTIAKQIHEQIESAEELLSTILRISIGEVSAERGFIALVDSERGGLGGAEIALDRHGEWIDDFVVPTTITGDVFTSHRSILTEDAHNDDALAASESIVASRILSAMCVPLLWRGEALGVLYVDNRAATACFSSRDLEFLTCIADLAGVALGNANLYASLHREMDDLRARLSSEVKLIGKSAAFAEIVEQIRVVAPTDMTVLITGESGTGKELVARAIHHESGRRDGPFIPVNCAAIPDTLIESELFGYAPNSGISGSAPGGKPGKFELASGGTIFLDEIGDMRLDVQATILRVLQDRVVERLGGTSATEVDVRVVAATNKELETAITEGGFRQDLYYRLNRFGLHLPPLRDRPDDIEVLVERFVQRFSRGKAAPRLPAKTMALLKRYSWPGNVRELESVIERAMLFCGRTLTVESLPSIVREGTDSFKNLKEVQEEHIRKVLLATGNVIAQAARILGISRKTLHEKVKEYDIDTR